MMEPETVKKLYYVDRSRRNVPIQSSRFTVDLGYEMHADKTKV